MIAVDTNIFVYAHRPDMQHHRVAQRAIKQLAEGNARWAIAWPSIHEFYRVVTDARLYKVPTPPAAAIAQISAWMGSPSLAMIGEAENHFDVLSQMALRSNVTGPRIHDARIAAICLCNGVSELWTADRDFSYFPKLKTRNPLVEKLEQ
jgi:uncharacterized protein